DRALELGCTELGQRLAGLDQQRLPFGCPGAASDPQLLGCHRATLPATCLSSVRSITGRSSAGNVTTSPGRPGPRTSRTASRFARPNLVSGSRCAPSAHSFHALTNTSWSPSSCRALSAARDSQRRKLNGLAPWNT